MRMLVVATCLVVGCSSTDEGDPCLADQADAASTLGCNGPIIGVDEPADEFAGPCTPDDNPQSGVPLQGSCSNTLLGCAHQPGVLEGICVQACLPAATYVSNGDCPSGSRCFTIDEDLGNAFCIPDCASGSDCLSGECDADGACVP
jgi:hypothetical protein